MATNRFKNVVEMMHELEDRPDQGFADDLQSHLAKRTLVSELVAQRVARGFSQKDMAEMLGCTQGRISKLEASPDERFSLGSLIRYAEAIGYEVEVTLKHKDVTLADRVKTQKLSVKKLSNQQAR